MIIHNIDVNIIDPPGFGPTREDTIEDLAVLTGAKVMNEELGDDLDTKYPGGVQWMMFAGGGDTVAAVDKYNIERIEVSHCTGLEKASLLHVRLGQRFFFGSVGAVLDG